MGSTVLAGCTPDEKVVPGDVLPNLIFILTDDQRWDALGYAGNNVIHTPEMDRFAQDGVYFRNSFVSTPICAASRASFFTGMYERTHGYTFQQGEINHAYMKTSYPALMKESSCHTGFFGKFSVSFNPADARSEDRRTMTCCPNVRSIP